MRLETTFHPQYLMIVWVPISIFMIFAGDCQRQGKIVCQQSMRCADQDSVQEEEKDEDDDKTQCREKKFLCLNRSALCNGKFECWPHDRTDEQNCKILQGVPTSLEYVQKSLPPYQASFFIKHFF